MVKKINLKKLVVVTSLIVCSMPFSYGSDKYSVRISSEVGSVAKRIFGSAARAESVGQREGVVVWISSGGRDTVFIFDDKDDLVHVGNTDLGVFVLKGDTTTLRSIRKSLRDPTIMVENSKKDVIVLDSVVDGTTIVISQDGKVVALNSPVSQFIFQGDDSEKIERDLRPFLLITYLFAKIDPISLEDIVQATGDGVIGFRSFDGFLENVSKIQKKRSGN